VGIGRQARKPLMKALWWGGLLLLVPSRSQAAGRRVAASDQ
jgi:hypothetical protein